MKKVIILFTTLVLAGCLGNRKTDDPDFMVVSIQPIKYLIDSIVGGEIEVAVLVPPGSGPETYEPTPTQIKSAEKAMLLFSTGLIGFEQSLLDRLPDKERFVDLSAGIDLINGSCQHGHEAHNHPHGTDPHIWTSPKALLQMAETAYKAIHSVYPDSVSYTANYNRLREQLIALDSIVTAKTEASGRRSFMIFHPGLTYYARDYGLEQIALEQDGKEPSARQLRQIMDKAKDENITKVFYQNEFPRTVVEVAADGIGAEPVEIDILGYDVVGNIMSITDLIISE